MVDSKFFTNKYPVLNVVKTNDDSEFESLPIGTIFTIKGIFFDSFELEPISKIKGFTVLTVTSAMLNIGFTGNDHVDV